MMQGIDLSMMANHRSYGFTMNSSPKSETTPYFECTYPSPMIPTVVSNFHLPNSNINKDGPHLKILEQPQTKFRFRYKSEMVGTHGQLKAESSDKNKNVFPTVQLCNWTGGPALVRLTLYTAEDNANDRKRHVHELNGKNCNKEGFTGGCEVVVDEENNYTAQFPNLGIIHIAKRDVQNIIFSRKKEELINFTCRNNPGLRTEGIQHNIPPIKLQKLKEEAEEEAKTMDLNKVVLRFQTFFYDTKTNCYRPITEYVDSDVIFNLKNASTGELKIVRISAVSSPCTGGAEVFMFVEKVKKHTVRIKFYELDKDNQEVWKGYGEFKESDVHHQYGIVFRTPAYRDTNIREPVYVKVQLERTTDNDTSEPLDFTYVPENLKRSNTFIESKVDYDINPQKRVRRNDNFGEVMDLKKRGNLFLGPRELKQPFSPEAPYQSPPHMVPSPMTPADSPSSQELYSPPHQGITHNPSISVSGAGDDLVFLSANGEEALGLPLENSINQSRMANLLQMNSQFQFVNGMERLQNNYIGNPNDGDQVPYYHHSPNYQNLPVYQQVPSPMSNGQASPLGDQMSPYNQGSVSPGHSMSPSFASSNVVYADTDNAFAQIQQFDAVHKEVISKNTSSMDKWGFDELVNSPVEQPEIEGELDILDLVNSLCRPKTFGMGVDAGDIQADFVPTQDKNAGKENLKKETPDIESLTKELSHVSVSVNPNEEKSCQAETESKTPFAEKDDFLKMTLMATDCLQSFANTGDIRMLLITHFYMLNMQNEHGENCLHSAILDGDKVAFRKILKASTNFCSEIFTSQNCDGETPLHLAVKRDDPEMVKDLLLTPGSDLNLIDRNGNTVLHLAAKKPHSQSLSAILSQLVNGEATTTARVINLYNFEGQTPLHLAATSGSTDSVRVLLKCGALVHLCERKQGANALHLAALNGHHEVARYLIESTSVTVDAGMLDGNTALHIAAQSKDKTMCAILMAGKANPNARNNLRKAKPSSEDAADDEEDDTEEEEEEPCHEELPDEGFTPIDYAEGDLKILNILQGPQESQQKSLKENCHQLEGAQQLPPLSTGAVVEISAQI